MRRAFWGALVALLLFASAAWADTRAIMPARIVLTGVTDDTTATVPIGYAIRDIFVRNTTANAITGGIKIGTTSGGTEVVTALAVGANAFVQSAATIRLFSATAATTLFIQDVTAWNSANVTVVITLDRAIP